ncbi:copper resistance system multicopper oxidase [Neptuniibacter sp. QD37_6]|uniref:copper resistance system multicopper oxidase n=1 Tax=Neptuniibacter sp. QD37_6 TaxID=3398210 RepID=UPI0039F47589
MKKQSLPINISSSRRRFVTGLAMGGVLAGFGFKSQSLFAATSQTGTPELRGNNFDLTIGKQTVNFTGAPRFATTVNGSLPAPVLRFKEGETVTLRVTNTLTEDSSIHWHGLILPPEMDGVPGLSFAGIKPGESYNYQFKVTQSGTYWYHSHSGFQEQTGLYGAIVIEPKEPPPYTYDRDYVVMLSDWTDEDPNDVYAKLKKMSHYYNFNERTLNDTWRDIKEKGVEATFQEREMWNVMRMSQTDISDVTGYTYSFLMNGITPAEGWKGLFKKGEKVLLRFINSAAMTFFDVRIPGLKMTVVAADGQYVQPVSVDEFRIGVAETYDVIVEPEHDMAYTVFAQAIDRSGYARGTLTPDYALTGKVPALDPVPLLTHTDMGMDHGMHNMGSSSQMDHSQHSMNSSGEMDHSQHNMHNPGKMDHSQHNMNSSGQIDHSQHSMANSGGMDHSMHSNSSQGIKHADTEYGPHVDMRADNPQYRLDDPGVGLRNNGRRVLTYADLKNLNPTPDPRDPTREIDLHLTGNMSRYMWSINGVKYSDAAPIQLKYGERVRINFVNDTMMNHPMHLHGMWSDLETGDNRYIPRKHTVVVQPGARISYRVTADAKGKWAFHCHLIYHMLGMFREVHVS